MNRQLFFLLITSLTACVLAGVVFLLLNEGGSLSWRMEQLAADIKYALHPPQEVVFVPVGQGTQTALPSASPTSSLTPSPTSPPAAQSPSQTPTVAPTATLTPFPIPPQAKLRGILHEYQMWNNCGPANLAMALSFWGWKGDQRETAAFLKPNQRDKNVMPYEMVDFVLQKTDLKALARVGGDLSLMKTFISEGFPVLAEKGFEGIGFDGWMGHYEVVSGYDDATGRFLAQDSYKGPDYPVSYEDFISQWRAFNYTYIIIYRPELRQRVIDLLGLQYYDNFNYHTALQKAQDEAAALTGRDLFFALFNQGTNQVALKDYAAAAAAYDAAFANYALIPQAERPWRMLWYQTGPYFAYFYTGRYQDVINLASATLEAMSEPILEETYYWRAKAEIALAQVETATKDLKKCLEVHPGFEPCQSELQNLGVNP